VPTDVEPAVGRLAGVTLVDLTALAASTATGYREWRNSG
jgi:hypothetical protein